MPLIPEGLLPIERFLLTVMAPTVLTLALLEALVLSWRTRLALKEGERYDWAALGASLFDYVLRIVVTVALPFTIAAPLVRWVGEHRLTTIAVDGWLPALALFVGVEFFYYGLHRGAHRIRWFWANHAVHHSPNQLNLGASLRIGAFGRASGNVIFMLPLLWIGFDLRTVVAAITLNLLYQFWLHATWIPKLGPLEGIFNTPSAHRVHHASNLEYLDANYGGVLMIFDRLFGTYVAERDDVPCTYGWVQPLASNNPFKVEFAQWAWLARDLWRARSLREAIGLLLQPPGWRLSPQQRTTTEALRERAGVVPRFGVRPPTTGPGSTDGPDARPTSA